MSVRPACLTDAAALARVHVASWRSAYRGLMPAAVLDALDVAERESAWRERLTGVSAETWVVESESGTAESGTVVGFASFGPSPDDDDDRARTACVFAMYLDPAAWRRGLGRRLARAALDELARRGFEDVSLWVLAGNAPARRFYETLGFSTDGAERVDRALVSAPLDELRYRMPLASAAGAREVRVGTERMLRASRESGRRRVGWKIGINVASVQERLGLSSPVVGALDARHGVASGETLRAAAGSSLRVEAEVAIQLSVDVGRHADDGAVRAAVGALAPAIEVVDYARAKRGVADLVADSALHHGFAVGDARVLDVPAPSALSARLAVGRGRPVPHDPALCPDLVAVVRHVADTLASHGERLRAGEWILSGSLVEPQAVRPGDRVVADVAPLGRVSLVIEAPP